MRAVIAVLAGIFVIVYAIGAAVITVAINEAYKYKNRQAVGLSCRPF